MPAAPTPPDFSGFPPLLGWVASLGELKRFRRGVILMQEGEPGGTMYFIGSGLLRAYTAHDDGRELTFGFYEAGQTLGELSLDGGPRTANVAVESAAVCSFVTRTTVERCIRQEPALAFELLSVVAERARIASMLAAGLALDKAYDRLVRVLRAASLPEANGQRCAVRVMTHQDLAQRIGCARALVTKLLGSLVEGGYLRLETRPQGRVWVIVKPLPPRF